MANLPFSPYSVPVEMDAESDLTTKFLSGQLSFAEYSSEWYGNDNEDEEDDGSEQGGDEPQQSAPVVEKRRRGRKGALSTALLGLMGEANLRFVRGDKETAEKMCHEIIKQVPTAPEPYQTLAQIYENDAEKSLQFSLLAAHLSLPDAHEWLRLAAISNERKDIKQEMICYTQAIRAEPHNMELHLKRLEFLSYLEEIKYPTQSLNISRVKCYHKIVFSMPESEIETIMKYTKLAATIYHNSQELEKALEVMCIAYKKCSAAFTLEDINIFLELLIARRQFQDCINVFIANAGIEIEAEIQTVQTITGSIEEQTNYVGCKFPADLPVDLKSKLLICFIHLGAYNLVQTLLNDFIKNDVEKAGDLYMDIEEALSSVGQHELAMVLLEPLVKHPTFDLGAVWLKHAACLLNLGKEDEAVHSYYKVLEHAPQHPEARRRLFSILEKRGCIEEALQILEQDFKYVVSASLLYQQCAMLKKYNQPLKYLEVGEALLSKTFGRFRHQDELRLALNQRSGIDVIHNFRTARGENPYHENDIHFDDDETFKLTSSQEWDLLQELLTIALQHKQYHVMQRLTFGGLISKALNPYRQQLEFYCLQACLLNSDYQNAFKIIKDLMLKQPTPRVWNLLNLVIHSVDETSHIKYITRLFLKDTTPVIRYLFRGNNFLLSGRYLFALKNYFEYHKVAQEPLSALLIGITLIVMAAQRTVDKHHSLILQGISYLLLYQKLRKCDQENYYNLGRAYHMLSINNLAIEYYEKALNCPPILSCPQHGKHDLSKEIAYNLFTLYRNQSPKMARKYLFEHLVIE